MGRSPSLPGWERETGHTEVLSDGEVDDAIAGYRYFGFEELADFLVEIHRATSPPDEAAVDAKYGTWLPSDQTLDEAFRHLLASRPDDFAPL